MDWVLKLNFVWKLTNDYMLFLALGLEVHVVPLEICWKWCDLFDNFSVLAGSKVIGQGQSVLHINTFSWTIIFLWLTWPHEAHNKGWLLDITGTTTVVLYCHLCNYKQTNYVVIFYIIKIVANHPGFTGILLVFLAFFGSCRFRKHPGFFSFSQAVCSLRLISIKFLGNCYITSSSLLGSWLIF